MEQPKLFSLLLEKLNAELVILPDKNEENPNNTLRALWHLSFGNRISPITAEGIGLPELSDLQLENLRELIDLRLSGMPLAHLTERQHFMGLDFMLNKGLYIPRKETELLAKTAIDTVLKDFESQAKVKVLDLCTGIGTIALSVVYHCPNCQVAGSDIYEPAIQAAKTNAVHFELEYRTSFYHADLFDPFESTGHKKNTDVIVCNPPYISTAKVKEMRMEISNHENEEAFDAGPFGLSIFNKLISEAPEYLKTNGYLIFECGAGQGEFLTGRIKKNGNYSEITQVFDKNGNIRVIKAKKINP